MLRLYDPRTGQVDALPAARLLRVHVPGPDVRSRVLADIVRRLAQRRHRRVLISTRTERDLTALNIPPADHADDGKAHLHIGELPATGRRLPVGPSTAEPALAWVTEQGLDPLAVRLAVLERHYRAPLELDRACLEAADRKLRLLRSQVAAWAQAPSKPMSSHHLAEAMNSLEADLDTPGALKVLRHLETVRMPPGSKFESCVCLDMVLALDLVRDIGQYVTPTAEDSA